MQHHNIYVTVEVAGLAIQTVAKDCSFHPVRRNLDSLKWDGTKRIDGWLSLYLGVAGGGRIVELMQAIQNEPDAQIELGHSETAAAPIPHI